MEPLPGGISNKLLFYVEPTLKNKKVDVALLYVGVNDLLNDGNQGSVQNLLDNLKKITLKCKSSGVTRILNSRIVVNNKLTSTYILSVNQHICNMCQDNSFYSLATITLPHQVSLTIVCTYLKSENVF